MFPLCPPFCSSLQPQLTLGKTNIAVEHPRKSIICDVFASWKQADFLWFQFPIAVFIIPRAPITSMKLGWCTLEWKAFNSLRWWSQICPRAESTYSHLLWDEMDHHSNTYPIPSHFCHLTAKNDSTPTGWLACRFPFKLAWGFSSLPELCKTFPFFKWRNYPFHTYFTSPAYPLRMTALDGSK